MTAHPAPPKPALVFDESMQRALERLKTPIWIFDLEEKAIPWGNQAACELWGANHLQALITRDFKDISASALARLHGYVEKLERGEDAAEQWTFYPRGPETLESSESQTVTVTDMHSLVSFRGRRALLIEAIVKERSEINAEHLRIIESMRHAPLCIRAYSHSGALLYENPQALLTYGPANLENTPSTHPKDRIFTSFVHAEERQLAHHSLISTKLHHGEHLVQLPRGQRAWHELLAREINDPVSGQPILLLIESNIDARKATEIELAEAHRTLDENLNLISTMLESIDQGFLIFDQNGVCMTMASAKSKSILGLQPAGLHLSEILRLKERGRSMTNSWLKLAFSNRFPSEDIMSHGPQPAEGVVNGASLRVKYYPMNDEAGRMKALVFIATDISQELARAKEAEAERKRAEMTLRVVEFKSAFRSFLVEFETLVARLRTWDGLDFGSLKNRLHTLKGSAALFNVPSLASEVHITELSLASVPVHVLEQTVNTEGERLTKLFTDWRTNHQTLFRQLGLLNERSVEISMGTLDQLQAKYSDTSSGPAEIASLFRELRAQDLSELLKPFENHVPIVAKRLGKRAALTVRAPPFPVRVDPGRYEPVLSTLIHLLNNAVDHGIEKPEIRRRVGKPDTGRLLITYDRLEESATSRWIRLILADDGQGLPIEGLRQRLRKKGVEEIDRLSNLEVAQKIFSTSASTSQNVSDVSGQGIGMMAVYDSILRFGGRMRVLYSDSRGTEFEILLPDLSY